MATLAQGPVSPTVGDEHEPWAWELSFAAALVFPIVGAFSDNRRSGRVHPAWIWGITASLGAFIVTEALTYSPLGTSIYQRVTEGSRGASVPPLEFAPPPDTPLMTGRSVR